MSLLTRSRLRSPTLYVQRYTRTPCDGPSLFDVLTTPCVYALRVQRRGIQFGVRARLPGARYSGDRNASVSAAQEAASGSHRVRFLSRQTRRSALIMERNERVFVDPWRPSSVSYQPPLVGMSAGDRRGGSAPVGRNISPVSGRTPIAIKPSGER